MAADGAGEGVTRSEVGEARESGEGQTGQPLNLTLVAILFVAGLVVALALANAGTLLPQVGEPVEDLSIYRVEFREPAADGGKPVIVAHVINTGPVDASIGAVQLGGPFPAAIRDFHVEPDPHLGRLETAQVHIPFDWEATQEYEVVLITTGGVAFAGEAMAVPSLSAPNSLGLAVVLGVFVGVIPVFLGIAPLPWFKRMRPSGIRLLGGLAAGVLAFLLVDTLAEAAEAAERLPLTMGPFLVAAGFLAGLGVLVWYGRRMLGGGSAEEADGEPSTTGRAARRARSPMAVAYLVAIAIGLHNFGEGLAVGAAQAAGAIAVAALLAVGFALHNVTEGVAIVAPALKERFGWRHPVALGLIAGAPVIPGAWLSLTFYSDAFAALAFAVAVGAILYVVVEILLGMGKDAPGGGHDDPWIYGGLALGLVIMYATDVVLHALVGGG